MADDKAEQDPEPGWYPDPDGAEQLRWWNGEDWTGSLTDDPSWEPVEVGPGPPSGPPRGAPPAWTQAFRPDGTTLVVVASVVLIVAGALDLAAQAVQESATVLNDNGPTTIGEHLLTLCLSPGVLDGALLLAGALLLRAVPALDEAGRLRNLRGVAIVLGTVVAAAQILGGLVGVVDVAIGGLLDFHSSWGNASIVLGRLAAISTAVPVVWLLAWGPLSGLLRGATPVGGEPHGGEH